MGWPLMHPHNNSFIMYIANNVTAPSQMLHFVTRSQTRFRDLFPVRCSIVSHFATRPQTTLPRPLESVHLGCGSSLVMYIANNVTALAVPLMHPHKIQ